MWCKSGFGNGVDLSTSTGDVVGGDGKPYDCEGNMDVVVESNVIYLIRKKAGRKAN